MSKRIPLQLRQNKGLEVTAGHQAVPPRPRVSLNIEHPKPPKNFSALETIEWERICEVLGSMEILDLTDEKLLVLWCRVVVALDKTHAELTRISDFTSVNAAGSVTQSAHMRNFLMLTDKLLKLCGELGLSPSGNAGLRLDRFRKPHEMSAREKRGRDLIA